MQIKFNEELHKYTVNDNELWGVTKLLSLITDPNNSIKNVPKQILEDAQIRGTNIHAGIESALLNKQPTLTDGLLQSDFDDMVTIVSWIREQDLEPNKLELLVHNKDLYCGTADYIGKYNGVPHLIDWKTNKSIDGIIQRKEYVKWALQLNLYNMALQYMRKEKGLKVPAKMELKVIHFPSNSRYIYIHDLNGVEYKLFAKMIVDMLDETLYRPDGKMKPSVKKKIKELQELYKFLKSNAKPLFTKIPYYEEEFQ